MEETTTPKPPKKPGCAILGWAIFSFFVLFLAVFGYKVLHYAMQIRSGKIIELPQFSGDFSATAAQASSANIVSEEILNVGNHAELGNKDAYLTIVEFADFECPYSKEASFTVRRMMAKYGDRVRFIYRELPIPALHPNSVGTSLAAECASEQGKFWQFHDKLYTSAAPFTFAQLQTMGREVGLESMQFDKCMIENRYETAIKSDMQTAAALGLRGTPTFFFNGQKVEGAIPEEVFENIIERLLK
jgi:protein-disulfide isomerase